MELPPLELSLLLLLLELALSRALLLIPYSSGSLDQSGFEEATVPPGFRDGLTGLGWLEELDSESLELDPDPEPELSESRAAPWEKGTVQFFE